MGNIIFSALALGLLSSSVYMETKLIELVKEIINNK